MNPVLIGANVNEDNLMPVILFTIGLAFGLAAMCLRKESVPFVSCIIISVILIVGSCYLYEYGGYK